MTPSHLKTRVEQTPETQCILNNPKTKDNVKQKSGVVNQPIPHTFRQS
jgi:hypothetical protein